MFERFTDKARDVVKRAQLDAHERNAPSVGSQHLLSSLLSGPENLAQVVLVGLHVDLAALRDEVCRLGDRQPDDAQALATLGIDLDEVRRQVDQAFGPGALDRTQAAQGRDGSRRASPRWDRSAKTVMELSLREALHLKHKHIGTEHVLLGMLHPGTGSAQELLRARSVDLDRARPLVAELLRGRRAG